MYTNFVENLITFAGKPRINEAGSSLFHQNDPVQSIFIIESGLVELIRHQPDGKAIVMQRAGSHSVLAEASIYRAVYHCDAQVKQKARVFAFSKTRFLALLEKDPGLSAAWAAHLAGEVQSARSQIDILSRKTVSERLDGWFAWKGNELPAKGSWKSIAVTIGVSPEALYRELAKR